MCQAETIPPIINKMLTSFAFSKPAYLQRLAHPMQHIAQGIGQFWVIITEQFTCVNCYRASQLLTWLAAVSPCDSAARLDYF